MRRIFIGAVLSLLLPVAVVAQIQACPNLTRNLSFGSRGSDVVRLQSFLIAQNLLAKGNNTGYFGSLTEAAVKSWQKKNGIVSSGTPATTGYGVVGPKTRAAIMRVCSSKSQNTSPGSPTITIPNTLSYPAPSYPGGGSTNTMPNSTNTVGVASSTSNSTSNSAANNTTNTSSANSSGNTTSTNTASTNGNTTTPLPPLKLAIKDTFNFNGAWATNAQGSTGASSPLGWGYMDPVVIQDGSDFYVANWYACDLNTKLVYCLVVMKNGTQSISNDVLQLGYLGGDTPYESYQTPMLFMYGGTLAAAYWYQDQDGLSSVAVDAINLNLPIPQTWVRLATYKAPSGNSFNYLGGAMGRDGTIYVAGALMGGDVHALQLLRMPYPWSTNTTGAQTLLTYASKTFQPLYPHVVVKDDGRVDVLTTLFNGDNCSETNTFYTTYKTAAAIEYTWGGSVSTLWLDQPTDAALSPSTNGDPCYGSARFPMDYVLSPVDKKAYSLVRATDLATYNPNAKFNSNADSTIRFEVRADGLVLNSNISSAFASVFSNTRDIESMSFTQMPTGEWVIFANNRGQAPGQPKYIGVVITKDFKIFSAAQKIDTSYGAGHQVKLAQPNKNTARPVDKVIYFYSGSLHNDTSQPNDIFRYSGGTGVIQ